MTGRLVVVDNMKYAMRLFFFCYFVLMLGVYSVRACRVREGRSSWLFLTSGFFFFHLLSKKKKKKVYIFLT